jgi:hypothetical protein
MNKIDKNLLDNPYNICYDLVKVEFRKNPTASDKRRAIEAASDKMQQLTIHELSSGEHIKVLNELINSHKGQVQVGYYKRTKDFRNASGYLLFQTEDEEWKSVDIKKIISISTAGTKQIR